MSKRVAAVGIGLAGSRMAVRIREEFGEEDAVAGVLNLSDQEIRASGVPQNLQMKVGGKGFEGAGKDRDVGFQAFNENKEELKEWFKENILVEKPQYLFLCFSAGGGTGSGMGPALTALISGNGFLKEAGLKEHEKPVVMGLIAIPDRSEGILSYTNTMSCYDHVHKLMEAGANGRPIARFAIVNNSFGKEGDHRSKFERVNGAVAKTIRRYLKDYGTSSLGSLDRSDRKTALTIMGLHSFYNIVEHGNGLKTLGASPFIQPEGARTKYVVAEVDEKSADARPVEQFLARFGVVSDDHKVGFYDIGNDETANNPGGIVHSAGFTNLRKSSEYLSSTLQSLQIQAKEAEYKDRTTGDGLDNVDAAKRFFSQEYHNTDGLSEDQDVSDILG